MPLDVAEAYLSDDDADTITFATEEQLMHWMSSHGA